MSLLSQMDGLGACNIMKIHEDYRRHVLAVSSPIGILQPWASPPAVLHQPSIKAADMIVRGLNRRTARHMNDVCVPATFRPYEERL